MQLLILSVLGVVLPLAAAGGITIIKGQCGGLNWTGPTTCAAGFHCEYKNDLYSQCLPSGGSGGGSQKLYGQCGGFDWTGPTHCAAGSHCEYKNDFYFQCLPDVIGSPPPAPSQSVATSIHPIPVPPPTPRPIHLGLQPRMPKRRLIQRSACEPPASQSPGSTFTATFTMYGGDGSGSPGCNSATAACGFYNLPGFNAAASQNIYGAGSGGGAGRACGTCWRLTPRTDSSNQPLKGARSIVVKVNNVCPAEGNPLCAMPTTNDTNSLGANVNFDLCKDDGAAAAMFGRSGAGLAVGTATEVSCDQWSGSNNLLH